jgi:hypothetical protein
MSWPAYRAIAFDPELSFARWRVYMHLVHVVVIRPDKPTAVDPGVVAACLGVRPHRVEAALEWLAARRYVRKDEGGAGFLLGWTLEEPAEFVPSPEERAKANAASNNRRARIIGNGGTFTHQDVARMLSEQGMLCYYCGDPLVGFHIEHKTPLARGGSNGPENLCIACPHCNARKHTKTEDEFFAIIGRRP